MEGFEDIDDIDLVLTLGINSPKPSTSKSEDSELPYILCCLGGGKTDLPVLGPGGGVGILLTLGINSPKSSTSKSDDSELPYILCCLGGGKTDLPVLGPGGGVGTDELPKA